MTAPAGLRIVALQPAHVDAVAALLAGLDPWRSLGRTVERMAVMLQEPWQEVWVVEEPEGGVCGVLVLQLQGALVSYVRVIAVAVSRQGEGIGRALLHHAEARGRTVSNRNFLFVTESNRNARGFYERLGYVQVGAVPGFVSAEDTELLLMRNLDQPSTMHEE